MTRKRSKCLFILFAIILVVCLVASFVNFTYPFAVNGNFYTYSNFVSNLKLGEDVGNGLRFVYRIETEADDDFNVLKNSTMLSLESILSDEGYKDVYATGYGDNGIVLHVGNILTDEDSSNIESLARTLGTLSFSTSQDGTNPFARADQISAIAADEFYDASTGNTTYYVKVDFKNVSDVAEATKDGGTVYIYFGDELYTQMDLGDDGIPDGYIMIQSEGFTTLEVAKSYANKMKTGMLPLALTCLKVQNTSPSYGLSATLFVSIAMVAFVVALFALLIIKYKHMGWLACFNLLFFVVIGLFLLQSIPFAHFNLAGLIGILIGLLVSADSLMTLFEKAKQYYQADTKLYVAFKAAQKESWQKILLQNFLLIFVGFASIFVPTLSVQSFGWAMLVLPFVTLFTSLVLMRLFIKMYLALNSTDGKKCNFHKGGTNVK